MWQKWKIMFLGFDISKANFDAVLIIGDAKPRRKAFPNTPAGRVATKIVRPRVVHSAWKLPEPMAIL